MTGDKIEIFFNNIEKTVCYDVLFRKILNNGNVQKNVHIFNLSMRKTIEPIELFNKKLKLYDRYRC